MRLKFDILELKKFLPHLIFLMVFVSFKVGSDELKEVIVDCENCPQLIEVKPGSFIKGSPQEVEGSRDDERPQHEVNIAYTFYASKFEVKRIEYEQFINDTGYDMSGGCYGATEEGIVLGEDLSWFEPGYQVSDDHPVVCVSWNDAKAYVRWLSQKTGFKYRLFSESEWEYIARAGTSTTRFWGDSDEGCEYANGADLDITPEAFLEEMKGRQSKIVLPDDWKVANCHDGYMTSSPVGSFKPNAFGIYDILGMLLNGLRTVGVILMSLLLGMGLPDWMGIVTDLFLEAHLIMICRYISDHRIIMDLSPVNQRIKIHVILILDSES